MVGSFRSSTPFPPSIPTLGAPSRLTACGTTACNGTIIQDKDMGEVIQLQGDHRTKVMDFLTDKDKDKMGKYALQKDHIKIHGF